MRLRFLDFSRFNAFGAYENRAHRFINADFDFLQVRHENAQIGTRGFASRSALFLQKAFTANGSAGHRADTAYCTYS